MNIRELIASWDWVESSENINDHNAIIKSKKDKFIVYNTVTGFKIIRIYEALSLTRFKELLTSNKATDIDTAIELYESISE